MENIKGWNYEGQINEIPNSDELINYTWSSNKGTIIRVGDLNKYEGIDEWGIEVSKDNGDVISETRKTKKEAMDFAIGYMKKHPKG